MEKEPKIKTERVIAALKNWSPHGLCGGTLVRANGERAKTEACAIGCLALEFATSRSGRRFFAKEDRKRFIKINLYHRSGLHGAFQAAVHKYFGLTAENESQMMSYNDNCLNRLNNKADETEKEYVPYAVRKTILSLRKQYKKFQNSVVESDAE